MDAVHNPRTILLLGGTSEIGLAIAEGYLARQSGAVLLAARAGSPRVSGAVERLETAGAREVTVLDFDARDTDSHPGVLQQAFEREIDVAVVAFGLLGDAELLWQDQQAAVALAETNFTGALSVGVLLGQQMTRQGHGLIIALSSVAGEKVRRSNFVYGSSKAGFDGFYENLGAALEPAGVQVLVVRPGAVSTKMIEGMKPAPLTVDARTVAEKVLEAADAGSRMVRVPWLFGPILWVIKHLPGPIFRRLRI